MLADIPIVEVPPSSKDGALAACGRILHLIHGSEPRQQLVEFGGVLEILQIKFVLDQFWPVGRCRDWTSVPAC